MLNSRNITLWIGLGDFFAGLMLMSTPEMILRLLCPHTNPPVFFVQFIGSFVFSVGVTHLLPWFYFIFFKKWYQEFWLHQLQFSACIRICVVLFLSFSILFQDAPWVWLIIVMYDLVSALFQFKVIRSQCES